VATRRSGLGRGLGALIPSSDPVATTVEAKEEVIDLREDVLREVPIGSIKPNSYQPRKTFDEAALEPLAESIKELGVLQPLLVRQLDDGGYELIAGERRLRASKKAGLKHVPVIVKKVEDIRSLQEALVENLHRKDLNAIDEASAYRQLIDDFSMTHDDVAKRVGKSRTGVTNMLRLLNLDSKVQKLLIEDKITEGHARALLGTDDKAFQLQLAEKVSKDGYTVRNIEESVRTRNELANPQTSSRAKAATGKKTPAAILDAQERFVKALDTRVTVTLSGKKGKITIDFADFEDLGRIADIVEAGSDFGED
jgi:ParB family chromosome partitioning protein